MKVTKDDIVAEIITKDPDLAQVLMAIGMHCIGCMASYGETLGEACMVHGLDPDNVVEYVNDYEANKG